MVFDAYRKMQPISHAFATILLTFISICLHSGCQEPPLTVINGRVTDRKTGAPVLGVFIYLDYSTSDGRGGNVNDIKYLKTDAQGQFTDTHDSDYAFVSANLTKPGYVTRWFLDIQKGEINNLDIRMVPQDATLCLTVKNTSSQQDTIYVVVQNQSVASESNQLYPFQVIASYPLVLAGNANYTEWFALPSDEYSTVYWDDKAIFKLSSTSKNGSVYLLPNDTTAFLVEY
ncbi:MAG: hypothetical protein IT260_22860 [Saprospiraceae bacterium]|nr:hypothetical protein [Saprospiraceae bacterium]